MPVLKVRAKNLNEVVEGSAFLFAKHPIAMTEKAAALLEGDAPAIEDFEQFARTVLGWGFSPKGFAGTPDNPIPDATVNPLFPATVKNHATLGFAYQASTTDALNAALTVAPSTSVTSGTGVTIAHGQTNLQLMYTHRF